MDDAKNSEVGLISLSQAASLGVSRVRMPRWSNQMDHLKIDIIDWLPGPWLHLYSPLNKEINGRDPVDKLGIGQNYEEAEFEPYTGPLPDSDEYKAAQAMFSMGLHNNQQTEGT